MVTKQSPEEVERRTPKVRATQSLVSHMGFVWSHPSLTLIEVAWRWLFGVPFLLVVWGRAQLILAQIPPSAAGLDRVELQNPWLSSVLLAEAFAKYQPVVLSVLYGLLPMAIVGWAVASGIGRCLVLARMNAIEPLGVTEGMRKGTLLRKLPGCIVLQALWLCALLSTLTAWYTSVGWAAAQYVTAGTQPNLIGYLCWLIFFSLGYYTLWALVSWTLAMAPVLLVLEGELRLGASWRALRRGFAPGKTLAGKLVEVGLVMAIVKIMLIVLDMVLSAAPLPFADEFGQSALHVVYMMVAVAFLLGNDYFHIVRLRSVVGLWQVYRRKAS